MMMEKMATRRGKIVVAVVAVVVVVVVAAVR